MKKLVPENAVLVPDGAERVFKGQLFDTYHWQQEMFDGSFETFEMLRRVDAVSIIAIKDDKLVVNHEEQPGRSPWYGIPAGRHDVPGEDELAAAQRELVEETGMTFKTWKLVDVVQPVEKIEWFVYVYLAMDFVNQEPVTLDKGEKIQVKLMTLDEYQQLKHSHKVRYWSKHVESAESLEQIINLPEFQGKEIER